jgi:hypothetical protein
LRAHLREEKGWEEQGNAQVGDVLPRKMRRFHKLGRREEEMDLFTFMGEEVVLF